MIKLVVGLGNPGKKYELTRHNIGFMVLDNIAENQGLFWKEGFQGQYADAGGFTILKPLTYMNLSGESVGAYCRYFKISPESVIVVHDELDFEYGIFKIRKNGSAAGHNGIKSIIAHLGTENFGRIRMGVAGISRQSMRGHTADYVLAPFTQTEQETLGGFLDAAAGACTYSCKYGIDKAMLEYNKKI